jgi:hypothetical protein
MAALAHYVRVGHLLDHIVRPSAVSFLAFVGCNLLGGRFVGSDKDW